MVAMHQFLVIGTKSLGEKIYIYWRRAL
jgi:hypothetical protein